MRRSDCAAPGISRRRRGRGFEYFDPDGERVDDPEVLERIADLVIPPAWRDVWICMDPRGLTEPRVLACAVRLLDLGFFRIGSEDYAERNESYGLTTMLREHVTIGEREVIFDFPAKSGQRRVQAIADPEALAMLVALKRRRRE